MRHLSVALCLSISASAISSPVESIVSPDGRIRAVVSTKAGGLTCNVNVGGKTVIETPLIPMSNGAHFAAEPTIAATSAYSENTTFPSRHGVHSDAVNRYNGRRISIRDRDSDVTFDVNVRVFDDGVAFRYEFPGMADSWVAGERTQFILPEGSQLWHQPDTSVYEGKYREDRLANIPTGTTMGPPVVAILPGSAGYLAITQSGSGSFGNPYLVKRSGRTLEVAYPDQPAIHPDHQAANDLQSPWHVIVIGSDLNALVNADLVEALAPPPDPQLFPEGSMGWITPGRSVWDWMSHFPGGITPQNARLNNLWAAELGFEYNTIDEGWNSWNGGNCWELLRDVATHARSRGVRLIVWARSEDLLSPAARTEFFSSLKTAGVSGFKANFFNFGEHSAAAADRMELMEAILREAAAFELVANLHGCPKPIGQFRTYPNLLNCEAVAGRESKPGQEQEIGQPFTRFLAGPADFTPVAFDRSNLENTRRTTAAYELATTISMAAPLITFGERSDRMASSPFAPVLRKIPSMWDETIVLPASEIGKVTLMARRSGRVWFVGGASAGAPQTWNLPLNFLEPGETYQAEIIRDGSRSIEYQLVDRDSVLTATAATGGGFVARIAPPEPAISAIPFATAFNPGTGEQFFVEGVSTGTGEWVDSAVADTPPTWRWRLDGPGADGLHVSIDAGDAFYGGASLRVSGTLEEEVRLRLYATDLPVAEDTKLRIVSKRGAGHVPSGMKAVVSFEDDRVEEFDIGPTSTSGWTASDFDLGSHAGRRIREIGFRFENEERVEGYSMQIGEIIVFQRAISEPAMPTSLRVIEEEALDADSLRLRLEWNPPLGMIRYYNVYSRWPDGRRTWLGASDEPAITLRSIRRRDKEEHVHLEIEAVAADFGRSIGASMAVNFPPLPNLDHQLAGTVIGTKGSWLDSGFTREKAFDNNPSTYFDAPKENSTWIGLDLGANGRRTITGIRYCPRRGWTERMVGGVFQGANNADFSDAVHLGTITSAPAEGVFSTLSVSEANRFRYVRYLSPPDGMCNVAELQFYGLDPAEAWTTAFATGGGARVPFQAVETASSARPEEVNQVIDGKDAGGVGWTVRTDSESVQSLIVKTAQPVRAQSFDLVLCFLSGRPGCYPDEFALSFTTDSQPSLSGKWQPIVPERFTAMGPELRVVKDGRLGTTDHGPKSGDAIFQVWMKAPIQPVTGFRIDIFPSHNATDTNRTRTAWQDTGEVCLTEFRVNSKQSSTTNLAAGRPVGTSHPLWSGMSSGMLTDGLPGTFVHPADPGLNGAFHFQIDLGLAQRIDHIALRSRADGNGTDRMSRIKVALFDNEPAEGIAPTWTIVDRADGSHPEPGGIDILRAADGDGICRGRYLRISSDSTVSFSPQLAEVEVYGTLAAEVASLEADGKTVPVDTEVKIPAGARLLNITFSIPGANLPDQLPIRWRLEGLHDDWQTTRGLSAQVMDPPSGSYTLEAEVGHTDGEWDAQRLVLPLVVARHFWEQPEFLIPVAACGVGVVLLAGRRARQQQLARRQAQLRHKSALAEERTRIARDMHDEVGARLSQIAMMQDLVVRRHTLPEEARVALSDLSFNTRRAVDALDRAVWAVNPSHDTLSGVVEYLSNTATSYLAPLEISCHLDVPLEWPAVEVRAQVRHQLILAFQEALQNIAKHSGATKVTLEIRYDARCLGIRISDNGSGFREPLDGHGCDGISNMRARLASISGKFSIRDAETGGVEVEMRIPL